MHYTVLYLAVKMAGSEKIAAISCRKNFKQDIKLLLLLRMISTLRLLNQLRRQT